MNTTRDNLDSYNLHAIFADGISKAAMSLYRIEKELKKNKPEYESFEVRLEQYDRWGGVSLVIYGIRNKTEAEIKEQLEAEEKYKQRQEKRKAYNLKRRIARAEKLLKEQGMLGEKQ